MTLLILTTPSENDKFPHDKVHNVREPDLGKQMCDTLAFTRALTQHEPSSPRIQSCYMYITVKMVEKSNEDPLNASKEM